MPSLDDPDNLMTSVISDADHITFEAVVSTSADQTAIAPGKLQAQWEQDGRRYFRYRVDEPILNFFAFLSGRYEVERQQWHGEDLEVSRRARPETRLGPAGFGARLARPPGLLLGDGLRAGGAGREHGLELGQALAQGPDLAHEHAGAVAGDTDVGIVRRELAAGLDQRLVGCRQRRLELLAALDGEGPALLPQGGDGRRRPHARPLAPRSRELR